MIQLLTNFYFLNQNILAWRGLTEQRSFFAERGWAVTNNGTVVGNVYTALRQPIEDFGYIGLPSVMIAMGCFFVFLYNYLLYLIDQLFL